MLFYHVPSQVYQWRKVELIFYTQIKQSGYFWWHSFDWNNKDTWKQQSAKLLMRFFSPVEMLGRFNLFAEMEGREWYTNTESPKIIHSGILIFFTNSFIIYLKQTFKYKYSNKSSTVWYFFLPFGPKLFSAWVINMRGREFVQLRN